MTPKPGPIVTTKYHETWVLDYTVQFIYLLYFQSDMNIIKPISVPLNYAGPCGKVFYGFLDLGTEMVLSKV